MSLLALDWHPITPLQSMQVVARQNPSKSRIHAHLKLILGRSSLQLEIRQGGGRSSMRQVSKSQP